MVDYDMKTLPDIPRGLGNELLSKKYGKNHQRISDLLLRKFSIEFILLQNPEDNLKEELESDLRSVFSEIASITDYLRTWYFAYYNFCSKCDNCTFNHDGRSCSFYGENNIPEPDPNHPTKVCSHCNPKKILANN